MARPVRWTVPLAVVAVILCGPCATPRCQEAGRWTSNGPYGCTDFPEVVSGGGDTLFSANGELIKSTDGGATWKKTGLGDAGVVACDPGGTVVYASRWYDPETTLYRSGDGGGSWVPTKLGLFYISALAVRGDNPDIVYVGGESAGGLGSILRKTTDGGETWTDIDNGFDQEQVWSLTLDPGSQDTLYVCIGGSSGGVFRSRNGGGSWESVGSLEDARQFVINPKKRKIQFAFGVGYLGIWRSKDYGATWQRIQPAPFDFKVTSFAMDPLNPSTLYAGLISGEIYRSTNSGTTWRLLSSIAPYYAESILPSPANRKRIYISRFGALMASSDKGRTWNPTSLGAGIVSSLAAPDGSATLYAGFIDGGLFKSVDGGASWRLHSLQEEAVLCMAVPPSAPLTVYAATPQHQFILSSDGGTTWTAANGGLGRDLEIKFLVLDPFDDSRIYAGGSGGLFRSDNGAKGWTDLHIEDISPVTPATATALAMDPHTPGKLYANLDGLGVVASLDGGLTWQAPWGLYDRGIVALAADPRQPGVVYAAGGGVFKSSDGGMSWSRILSATIEVKAMVVDPNVSGRLFIGLGYSDHDKHGVLVSEDGGATWGSAGPGLEGAEVSALLFDPANPSILHAGIYQAPDNHHQGRVHSIVLDP